MIRVIFIGLLLCAGASVSNAVLEPPLRTTDWRLIC
jgi:hypothetical protein